MRSHEQNSLMWSLLTDLANQVPWPVNGSATQLSPDDWKDIITAGMQKHHRMAQGIDGGFVILGMRTSKMNKQQMCDVITLAIQFGDKRGVQWTLLPPVERTA